MQFIETQLPGCYEIQPRVLSDARGCFVKTFHRELFSKHGLATEFSEVYHSMSRRGVLRGLHFQLPPHDHAKLVYCVMGQVLDVAVDLRVGSPSFGQFALFGLSADQANAVYLPTGLAHGFYTLSEQAVIVYQVTTVYVPSHDAGIRWDSVGIPWPNSTPILSERDNQFHELAEYASPFTFDAALLEVG